MAEVLRVQVKVLNKKVAIGANGKLPREFAALAKRFQDERMQCESREAYQALVIEQDAILAEKAKELGIDA